MAAVTSRLLTIVRTGITIVSYSGNQGNPTEYFVKISVRKTI